jgi:photosystem II stability/assembly factor-like uncharacterized protein
MTAAEPAGGVTVGGLMVQVGAVIVASDGGETWHDRVTSPVKLPVVPTEMFEEAVPPGVTAVGKKGESERVKSCANAAGSRTRNAANTRRKGMRAVKVRRFHFDGDESDFSMSGFRFN